MSVQFTEFPPSSPSRKSKEFRKMMSRQQSAWGISDEQSIDSFIESIVSICYEALHCDKLLLLLYNKDKKGMAVVETKGFGSYCSDSLKAVCDYVISSGEIVRIDDFGNDSRFNSNKDVQSKLDDENICVTVLSAPIYVKSGKIIGVLSAINKLKPTVGEFSEPDYSATFDRGDEIIIQIVSDNAGIAVERMNQYYDAVRAHRKSSALLSIVRARTSEQTIENILQITINAAYDLLLPERVTVYLCDHREEEAWICVSKDHIEGLTVHFGEGVAGTVAATGQTIRIENAYDDPRFLREVDADTGYTTKSMLCAAVPGFGLESKPIAVIQLINKADGKVFDEEDEAALTDFCEEVSLAFRRKMLEVNLLKVARSLRQDTTPEKYNTARLEESLLSEYSSTVQRSRYSLSGSHKVITRLESPPAIHFNTLSRKRSDNDLVKSIYVAIHRWDVDPFDMPEADLMLYVEQMLASFEIIDTFKISVPKLRSFIMAVHAGYPEQSTNAFHNFRHGWSVMHITYMLLRNGAAANLSPIEIFAALIGSLCHDLDHPGHSNAFEIASFGRLSMLYGDDAVLERHHTAETLRLLRIPENDILENLSHSQKLEMRRLLNSGILATDMAQHFTHVEQLVARGKSDGHIDHTSPAERRNFLGNLLHCADLSGQAMPLSIAQKWCDGCLVEFHNQALREEELGIPMTPHIQGLESELTCMQLQYGFVANIVVPLWKSLSGVLPAVKVMTDRAVAMKDYYNTRMQELADSRGCNTHADPHTDETRKTSEAVPQDAK